MRQERPVIRAATICHKESMFKIRVCIAGKTFAKSEPYLYQVIFCTQESQTKAVSNENRLLRKYKDQTRILIADDFLKKLKERNIRHTKKPLAFLYKNYTHIVKKSTICVKRKLNY